MDEDTSDKTEISSLDNEVSSEKTEIEKIKGGNS